MSEESPSAPWPLWAGISLAGIALARLASLGRLALTDNSESRYGYIGWQMFRSNDWVTPRLYIDGQLVPFWGKPPLQFWLTSLSYHVFGVSEWSARLPSFLLAVAIVAATVFYARGQWGTRVAALAGVVLSTSAVVFLLAGACVLDMPLTAAVTGAMLAFARFAEDADRRSMWGRAFFLALAVGALAKGPIALVLVGLALFVWLTLLSREKTGTGSAPVKINAGKKPSGEAPVATSIGGWHLLRELPWFSGLTLFFAVAAPWYVLAEKATPGFLQYFLVHEHFLRFVSHDYGDLYGAGRKQPYGAIWPMLLGALLPWTALAIAAFVRFFRRQKFLATLRANPWLTYSLVWGLAPAVFFTPARQILFTYLLPGLPGLAIATAVALDRWMDSKAADDLHRWLTWHLALLGPIAVAGAIAAAVSGASLLLAAMLAAAGVAAACLAGPILRRSGPAAMAATFGATTTLMFCLAVLLFAPRIDERYSAKTLLAELHSGLAANDRPIVMPLGDENSAAFYAEAILGRRFEHHAAVEPSKLRQRLNACPNAIFLFKRKDWQGLKSELTAGLVPLAETAHWVACEAKPPPAASR